jgi:S1-C subfamily serine protease
MSKGLMIRRLAGTTALVAALHIAGPTLAADALLGGPIAEMDRSTAGPVPHFSGVLPDDAGFNSRAAATLGKLKTSDSVTRGAKEASLFRTAAPSVVMVVTEDGLGSGSVISASGDILTNAHVLGKATKVGVIYKPKEAGREITESDLVRAVILKIDPITDLALIHAEFVPEGTKPLALATPGEVDVGYDVHAIGHPTGETWTYTKGVVSQIRAGYDWQSKGDEGVKHHADVIQTQTPINPGNSGGPLLSDKGNIVGVNSFGATNAQNMNYAVEMTEIQRFLAAPQRKAEPAKAKAKAGDCSKGQTVYEGRNKANTGNVVLVDTKCQGKPDIEYVEPDDKTQPIVMRVDSARKGHADQAYADENRDGKWDIVQIDIDDDGEPDVVGIIEDGSTHPARYVKYRK